MKGIPIVFDNSNDFSTVFATKKTTPALILFNLNGIVDNYKITNNKSLSLNNYFGRRTIHLQGKVMTVNIARQMNNCDGANFAITEDRSTNLINTMLSAKNKAPIFSKLSFVDPKAIGNLKKRASLLDLAYLRLKKT